MTQQEWITLSIYIGSGILLGFILRKIILPFLLKFAKTTSIKSDELIISIVQQWVIIWFFALGLFLGLK